MLKVSLRKDCVDIYEKAQIYFRIALGAIGEDFSPKELQLLSFIAVRENILSTKARNDFKEMYDTTEATLNNTLVKLKKRGFVEKIDGKNKVSPNLFSNLNDDVVFNIILRDGKQDKK